MVLVEEQEEEEEGAVGAGGLLPRFAVGSEVEVLMADRGFHRSTAPTTKPPSPRASPTPAATRWSTQP
jgi:hypothetical protein